MQKGFRIKPDDESPEQRIRFLHTRQRTRMRPDAGPA